tara:strand:+ start:1060 stop:1557 length:498 start_codon:yes stop_codon:yes gene_type:complete
MGTSKLRDLEKRLKGRLREIEWFYQDPSHIMEIAGETNIQSGDLLIVQRTFNAYDRDSINYGGYSRLEGSWVADKVSLEAMTPCIFLGVYKHIKIVTRTNWQTGMSEVRQIDMCSSRRYDARAQSRHNKPYAEAYIPDLELMVGAQRIIVKPERIKNLRVWRSMG